MAASTRGIAKFFCGPSIVHLVRQYRSCVQRLPVNTGSSLVPFATLRPSRCFGKAASYQDEGPAQAAAAAEGLSRYKDRPWDYLESEEYIERYGTNPVWADYRRNHKGGIPPQKTRKTCIRGDKICKNPCPICRDPNIIVHHQNIKLLQQFISPHTGILYEHTRTGVCMKQQKQLIGVINKAKDQGLLPFQMPYVEFSGEDYSNSHDAVGCTPPPTSLTVGDTWYQWYGTITPDEDQLAKVRKTYKAYLK